MLRRSPCLAALGVALLAAACSKGTGSSLPATEPAPKSGAEAGQELKQVSEAGGVTIEGTWLTESDLSELEADVGGYPLEKFVLVEIQFTTHSGDLSEIDMQQAARLRQGGSEVRPEAWVSVSDDSHHRAGVLVFPRKPGNGPVEVAVKMGDQELSLLWEAAPSG